MYLCVCILLSWFSVGFFSEGFSHWVFPLFFPLVGIGQHLPKSLCTPSSVLCVLFCIGSNYDVLVWRAQSALSPIGSNCDVLVWRAQSALSHIGRCMCTAHKLCLVAC